MKQKNIKQQTLVRIIISIVALSLLIAHVYWPKISLDAISIAFLVLACLPWLSSYIKSVEIPGIGKFELQEIKKQIQETQGAIQSVSQKAEFASITSNVESQRLGQIDNVQQAQDKLKSMVDEYNTIRATMDRGSARTTAMTKVVRQMVDLAPSLSNFNLSDTLKSSDRGIRLSAYAYLFAKPDFDKINNLVESVTEIEDKPFGQYWGIQAIGKVIANRVSKNLSIKTLSRLKLYFLGLQAGTDRHYELGKILKDLGA
jgi:hypothetical protein